MDIHFVTGNDNKFEEAKAIIPRLKHLNIDLPEIQEIDPHKIIEAKLEAALKQGLTNIVVEDTSLYFDCLNGLPGPLIKWFLKTLGNEGLSKLVAQSGNTKAQAKTMLGYAAAFHGVHYFEGVINGIIVSPQGKTSFGWDSIFQPDGFSKNFAEMSKNEKNGISMRRLAFENLKAYLDEQK